ncbi:MAG: helix-hairpin-helix domain-containing protein [Pseudomonadota bacterium]
MKNRAMGITKSSAAILCLLATLAIAGQVYAAKQPPATAVDVNRANVAELMTVPGLGHAKAQAIVDYRATKPFTTARDLVGVKGIGEKLFAKISPYVTVSGSAQAQQTPGTAGKAVR